MWHRLWYYLSALSDSNESCYGILSLISKKLLRPSRESVRSFRIVNREVGWVTKNNWKWNRNLQSTAWSLLSEHLLLKYSITVIWFVLFYLFDFCLFPFRSSYFEFMSHSNYSLPFTNSISPFCLLFFSRFLFFLLISIFFFFSNFQISLLSSVCFAIVYVASEDYTNFRIQLRKHRNKLLDPAAFNRL